MLCKNVNNILCCDNDVYGVFEYIRRNRFTGIVRENDMTIIGFAIRGKFVSEDEYAEYWTEHNWKRAQKLVGKA